jgi:tetratricopeptide (TPR) repeat protein
MLAFAGVASGEDSFDDLVLQGQTAVDTGRPEEALKLFAAAASMAPEKASSFAMDYAWAYVEEGYIADMGEDYPRADECYVKAFEICPEVAPAIADLCLFVRTRVFSSLLDEAEKNPMRADWKAVVKYAQTTVDIAPLSDAAHYRLGLAYERSGERSKAWYEYAGVVNKPRPPRDLKPLRDAAYAVSKSCRFDRNLPVHPRLAKAEAGDFKTYEDPPFIIHHHNLELAERTARALKYYLSHEEAGGLLPARTDLPGTFNVYIYGNGAEFAKATGARSWGVGIFDIVAYRASGNLSMSLKQDNGWLLCKPAPHELAHARLVMLLGPEKYVPKWLSEGIASASEPWMARRLRIDFLTGPKAKPLPFADVMKLTFHSEDVDTAETAYAKCMAVAGILAEKDPVSFRAFVAGVEEGKEAGALKKSFNLTPADLDKLIPEWLAKNQKR